MKWRFLEELRDPKPRLKPGFTYFRLTVFLVLAVAFLIVGSNVVTGKFPPVPECEAKGIDAIRLKEGTCKEDGSTLVVVDRHSTLKLQTVAVRILAVHYRKAAVENASGEAGDRLVTFDLSVENRIDGPAAVGKGQFLLNAGKARAEDVEFERKHDLRSFLAQDREIPALRTMRGTVTFRVPAVVAKAVREGGNLDVVNLGESVSLLTPEEVFSESEYGVIRVYH